MEKDFLKVIESDVPKNSLLISVGLPGSWKSPVTEEIARLKGFQILRSDIIRLEVLKGEDIFDNPQELRSKAAELAEKAHRTFVIAECACTEERSIERISKRTKENYESNALTKEAYLNNKALFQPIDTADLKKRFQTLPIIYLTIDTEYDTSPDWKIRKIEKR